MKQDNPGWLARHALAVRARLRGKPRPPVVPSAKARGDWLVRFCTVIAVASVAGVAAYISYWHAVEVVTSHGEQAVRGHLYPVVIDGIIVAASMVVLDAARHRELAPPLAWTLLWSGIGVTLAANVAAGVRYGLAGALWSAWPALAFVGCFELLMMLVRAAARRTETSGALASPGVSEGTGITLPAPVHPVSSRGARETEPSLPASGGVARRRGPASSVDEDALLAKVLEAGVIPPSYRAWSFEETGMYRSAPTRRVYDLARERLGTVRPDEERAAMNGAGHD